MLKIIEPDSFNFQEPATSLIRRSRSGLVGEDRRRLIKLAGDGFVDEMSRLEYRPDEELIRLIALGNTQKYGCNRNGDGFAEDVCQATHPTFVKFARLYRDHKNTNPAVSFGLVKLSHYNREMGRVELVVALNKTKAAAERNGGLVADKELEKLAKDQAMSVSMACTEPFDTCSACGNRAPNRAHYCTPATCVKYGGLRDNLGRTFADGYQLHAENPKELKYIDISHVFRPADRTAYVLGQLSKAASAVVLGGAQLADEMGLTMPAIPGLIGGRHDRLASLAAELAGPSDPQLYPAFSPSARKSASAMPDVRGDHRKFASALKALADARVVLPVREFLSLVTGDDKRAEASAPDVARRVPAAFGRLASGGDESFASNSFAADGPASSADASWAAKLAADFSLDRAAVSRRASLAAIRGDLISGNQSPAPATKSAAAADALATQYALYAVSALDAMSGSPDRPWLVKAAAAQSAAAI